ncbi:type II secretion system protein GspD [Edaphobacter bradus]|uniref:type II secretion system protein GspD n=1 Tax=Edaphobacter bradus TaxID=2259016 RepID=UPI0021DFB9F2|nr:hypothetical protein [Edaphobacter bradus]
MASKPQPRAPLAIQMIAFAMTGVSTLVPAQTPAPGTGSTQQAVASSSRPAPGKRQIAAAEDAYLAGARLLDRNDLAGAEARFEKAATLNPDNQDYALAASLAREHRVTELVQQAGKARLLGESKKAEALLAAARALDPQNSIVAQHLSSSPAPPAFNPEIQSLPQHGPAIAGPVRLMPGPGTSSFNIRGDSRDVVRQVMAAYGIRAVFDDSVQRQDLRFDLDDSHYQQATQIVLKMAGLFAVPLDPHSALVIKDTTENRQRFERQLQETIYIPSLTPEQMSELSNMVRTVFDVKQPTVLNGSGTLLIRAPEETLNAVNVTLADLIDGGGEVLLDINLYSVDRTRQRSIGIQFPQQIGFYSVESAAHDLVTANQSLVNQAISQGLIPANASDITIALALISSGLVQSTLLSSTIGLFGGGLTLGGVTMPPTNLHLALSSSDTRALDNIQLRVGYKQTGTFRAGTRYPVTTGIYSSGATPTVSQLAGVTINGISATSLLSQVSSVSVPQIQYEDLGLTLKATPVVQRSGRIAMHLDLKIEALAGTSLNNIPILASRQYVSDVTVRDGETALIASSLTKQESAAVNGLPGLGELPGFQTVTAIKTTDSDTSELVLLITPHVVRHRGNTAAGPRIALNLPGSD